MTTVSFCPDFIFFSQMEDRTVVADSWIRTAST